MNATAKHLQTINSILSKKQLRKKEFQFLNRINADHIRSISVTTDGGFDPESGEFHKEDRPLNYKIRLKYSDAGNLRIKCLHAEKA